MQILTKIVFFLLIPTLAMAGDIALPEDLSAKAWVIKSQRGDLWEKSLVVKFYEKETPQRRRVLSTIEAFSDSLAVVNHSAHPLLWKEVCEKMKTDEEVGGKVYSRRVRERIASHLGIRAEDISQMATAADMDNLAVVTKTFKPFTVTALVTAGAKTNAIRTGVDEGTHIEQKVGTVNVLILTNARLTDGAMARAIITATEAKTAAFEDLKVPSSYTRGVQATGTGTDTVIIVSGTKGPKVTYTGGHSKIGELIGKAVYEAVAAGLEKQNGFKRPK